MLMNSESKLSYYVNPDIYELSINNVEALISIRV